MTEKDARSSDGPLVRALAAPLRALLGATEAVLAATLRGLGGRDVEREQANPPSLRAIAGGASLRARRRSDGTRAEAKLGEERVDSDERALEERAILLEGLDDGRDLLLAVPRDPRTVFVTWRLGPRSAAALLEQHTPARVVRDALSIEVGDGASAELVVAQWIVPLQPLAESTYVDLHEARATARITLGTHDAERGFVALLPPVTVHLPAAGDAPYETPRWRVLPGGDAGRTAPPPAPTATTAERLHRRATTRGMECLAQDWAIDEGPVPATDPGRR